MEKFEFTALDEGRLDQIVAMSLNEVSRSYGQKLIEAGNVSIDGKTCLSKKEKVTEGQEISVLIPEPEILKIEGENIHLEIVYEDEYLMIVNKPRGMVVHPAPGNYSGTLVNAIMFHCGDRLSSINGVIRPGIVHRIDKDTSGLLVIAKCNEAHEALSEQFKEHSINRIYTALVYGNIKEESGRIDLPIGRDQNNRLRMWVSETNSKNAITNFKVMKRYGDYTLVECKLETGRTHQIRVHMAYTKHPLVGDPLYGPNSKKKGIVKADGQYLHAGVLGFIHPITKSYVEFESPLPDYFEDFLLKLDRRRL